VSRPRHPRAPAASGRLPRDELDTAVLPTRHLGVVPRGRTEQAHAVAPGAHLFVEAPADDARREAELLDTASWPVSPRLDAAPAGQQTLCNND
jgi:hypothetical protein